MQQKVTFNSSGPSYHTTSANYASVNTTGVPLTTTTNQNTINKAAYTITSQQPTQTVTTYNTTTPVTFTGGNATTYTSVGNTGAQQNIGYVSGGYTGIHFSEDTVQPQQNTEIREVREVREVRTAQEPGYEVRKVQSVGHPVNFSHVERIQPNIEQQEYLEEVDRPQYQKLYSMSTGQNRQQAAREERATKKSCCAFPCWVLWALLGLLGVVLGLLFGLGVIGGVKGPDAELSAPKVDIDAPNVDVNGPNVDIDTPKVDLNGPNVDVNGPEVDLNGPNVDVDAPKVDIETPEVDVNAPKVDLNGPNVDVETPAVDVNKPKVNLNGPNVDTNTPKVDVNGGIIGIGGATIGLEGETASGGSLQGGVPITAVEYPESSITVETEVIKKTKVESEVKPIAVPEEKTTTNTAFMFPPKPVPVEATLDVNPAYVKPEAVDPKSISVQPIEVDPKVVGQTTVAPIAFQPVVVPQTESVQAQVVSPDTKVVVTNPVVVEPVTVKPVAVQPVSINQKTTASQ